MRVTYVGTGARDDDQVCAVFGRDFPVGESVDVSDLPEAQQSLLKGNPTFSVDDGAPAKKAASAASAQG